MTSTTYQVTGMTCEHCVRAVSEELAGVPGVSGVSVALVPGGESAVTVTSDVPLTAEAVREALDEAGDYRLGGDLAAASDAAAPAPVRTLPVV